MKLTDKAMLARPRIKLWKPVPGYEGRYEVSSHGELRSLIVSERQTRKRPRLVRSTVAADGYARVSLALKGKYRQWTVHSIVAAAFIGPRPRGADVRHLNGIKHHNAATNIAYGSRADNMNDARRHGTICRGERVPWAKFTAAKVRTARRLHAEGASIASLARRYCVSDGSMGRVIHRQTWKHV